MIFILTRIIRKILLRKKIYIIVVVQIAIGMLILNIFSNLSLNIESKLSNLLRENKNMEFFITAKYKNNNYFDPYNFDIVNWGQQEAIENEYKDIPFNISILDILKEKYPDYEFILEASVNFNALVNSSMKTYKIYYSSNYDSVAVSSSFVREINSPDTIIVLPRLFPFKLDEKSFTAVDGKKYSVKITDAIDNVIYVPYTVYEKMYHPKDLINIKLTLILNDEALNSYNNIRSIIDVLESNNDNFLYSINSDYFNLLSKVNTAYEQAGAFNFFAAIILLIIMVSLAGMFSLIINSRKKELAICLALGSRKNMLCLECFLEILFLSVTGCLIGLLAGYIILSNKIEYATVIITQNHLVSIFEIVLSCIIALISVLPSFIIIKRLMPMEILRSE